MKCSFCGVEMERGTGKLYVQTTGRILYFCSRKCERNMLLLGRKPRHAKWTEAHRLASAESKKKPA